MARLNSWFPPDVMHALAWALIHSLWQAVGVAALAAGLMAFSRRPSVRYLIATGALALMLAAPVATFLLLMKPAPAPAMIAANRVYAAPAANPSVTLGIPSMGNGVAIALENSPKVILSPDVLPSSLLPWLVGAWLGGVAFFSLRLAGGFLLLEHRRRSQSAVPGPRILALCRELQDQLGLTRAIRYLECNWLQTPAVVGWIRPVVLLPVTALIGLSEEQLRAVIAHELAHIRRLDAFVNLFQILAETLLFYHPAVWWLSKRIRAERELACDEIAVSLTGDRLEYARVLTLMAEWEKAPALAMAANRGPLTERVFHILGRKPSGAGQRMLGLTGSVLFLAAALGAANALFGIAYPIPAAHAKESIKAALVSSQSAVDRIARQVLQASAPAPKDVVPVLRDMTGGKTAPDQTQAAVQPEKLVVPSPDLSKLVPAQTIPMPTVLASNDVPSPAQPPARGPSAEAPSRANAIAAAAAPSDAPSGVHDPDALTCDSPQLADVAKAVGSRICVQNSILPALSETGALSPAGARVRSLSDLPLSRDPTGTGDPDTVTCLNPQRQTGALFRGPIACAHNDFWAKLNAAGCVLSPEARAIIPSGTAKVFKPLACEHIQGRNGVLPRTFF